ncbi:MAG: hypothetical protein P4L50_16125, partial [Anaerolineaceae bacterium]|nr:hypothetical protein [Anaerolineaceae bacterium]
MQQPPSAKIKNIVISGAIVLTNLALLWVLWNYKQMPVTYVLERSWGTLTIRTPWGKHPSIPPASHMTPMPPTSTQQNSTTGFAQLTKKDSPAGFAQPIPGIKVINSDTAAKPTESPKATAKSAESPKTTEIFRCTQADGKRIYQNTPCTETEFAIDPNG